MADRKETYSSKLVLKDVISGETIPRIVARTPTFENNFQRSSVGVARSDRGTRPDLPGQGSVFF